MITVDEQGVLQAFKADTPESRMGAQTKAIILVDSYKSFGFGQKEMVPGKWGMYTGNGEQTNLELFDINGIDIILWHKTNAAFSIYTNYDYNLDADVIGLDRILFNSNNGVFTPF